MERWEADMIALGGDHIRGDATMPYGFQAMSALMYSGEYEAGFLTEYGDALLAFEQRQAEENPAALWARDAYTDLTFLPDDHYPDNRGHDPVIGFLSALGRNPEASTTFFAAPESFDPGQSVDTADEESVAHARDGLNDHLAYLASERNWWHTGESQAAHPVLGEALLAATAGYSSDATAEEALATAHRTPQSAGVMEQVMHLYGTVDPQLMSKQPGMSGYLAAMTNPYLPDVNYWLSDIDESQFTRGNNQHIYLDPGVEPLRNGRFSVTSFLTVLGRDEVAHQALTEMQGAYTLGRLDAFSGVDRAQLTNGAEALQTGATVRGVIDWARVDQVTSDFERGLTGEQREHAAAASWIKTSTGAMIGASAGAAGGALVAGGAGAAVVLIPIAIAGGGGLVNEYFNQGVDTLFGSQQDIQEELDRQRDSTEHEVFRAGQLEIGAIKDRYLEEALEARIASGMSRDDATRDLQEISELYSGGYQAGQHEGQTHGN
jgi:hypothetical protein